MLRWIPAVGFSAVFAGVCFFLFFWRRDYAALCGAAGAVIAL